MQKLKKINFKKIFCLVIFAFLIFAPRAARAAFATVSLTAPLRCVGSGTTKICDYIDFKNQQVVRNVGYIASYAGQTVGSVYMSTTGALTTGATVQYKLTTASTESLSLPVISAGSGNVFFLATDGNLQSSNMQAHYWQE